MNRSLGVLATVALLLGIVGSSDAGVLKRTWGEEFGATW